MVIDKCNHPPLVMCARVLFLSQKYLAGVVQNVYAVARYVQQRKSWTGPILQPPAIEKATAD